MQYGASAYSFTPRMSSRGFSVDDVALPICAKCIHRYVQLHSVSSVRRVRRRRFLSPRSYSVHQLLHIVFAARRPGGAQNVDEDREEYYGREKFFSLIPLPYSTTYTSINLVNSCVGSIIQKLRHPFGEFLFLSVVVGFDLGWGSFPASGYLSTT